MTTPLKHWKLGDIALARITKKHYAKVQVVKNEDGLFFDDKVLGFIQENNKLTVKKLLCYYVEIIRIRKQLWIPYTSMYLTERSRPFYGPTAKTLKASSSKPLDKVVPKKRKLKEDHVLPLSVKPHKSKEPDLNVSFEIRQKPLKQGKYENAFNEFIRRGKENLFDYYYDVVKLDKGRFEDIDYLKNVNASTEDKFELVIKNIVTEKEIESYLRQCWRYNFVYKQVFTKENVDNSKSPSNEKPAVTIHAPWCLVCGEKDKLWECANCPASFHLACRKEWLISIIHRKNPPKKPQKPTTLIDKILSSTRAISKIQKEKVNLSMCPSCMWGPKVGYDDLVWHKLGAFPWWPARVLAPGEIPSCLLSCSHSPHQWPLKYYGESKYSWGDTSRMCLFLPKHTGALESRDEVLRQAVLDACDDYITVYLT